MHLDACTDDCVGHPVELRIRFFYLIHERWVDAISHVSLHKTLLNQTSRTQSSRKLAVSASVPLWFPIFFPLMTTSRAHSRITALAWARSSVRVRLDRK